MVRNVPYGKRAILGQEKRGRTEKSHRKKKKKKTRSQSPKQKHLASPQGGRLRYRTLVPSLIGVRGYHYPLRKETVKRKENVPRHGIAKTLLQKQG